MIEAKDALIPKGQVIDAPSDYVVEAITVGTITTGAPGSSAAMELTKVAEGNFVLTATIPRGNAGTPGRSAYDIAVSGGYTGTEQQWLDRIAGLLLPDTRKYEHTQASAALTWTIAHNLGFRPTVTVLSVGNQPVVANVSHPSVNVAVVDFLIATAGSAHLA